MTKRKILIVDDDADFRSAVRVILESAGYGCAEADSAENGMKAVHRVQPDLIMLDVMMEDISSGFRFAKERLRKEDENTEAHIPILFVSSIQILVNKNIMERMTSVFNFGGDLLNKPVKPNVLLKKVEEKLCALNVTM